MLEVTASLPAAVRRETCYPRELWPVNTYTVSILTLSPPHLKRFLKSIA